MPWLLFVWCVAAAWFAVRLGRTWAARDRRLAAAAARGATATPGAEYVSARDDESLDLLLQRLSGRWPKSARIVALHRVVGLTGAEVAARLGLPSGRVQHVLAVAERWLAKHRRAGGAAATS